MQRTAAVKYTSSPTAAAEDWGNINARRKLFEQAIGPLEQARELAQNDPEASANEAEICRALFTAYVQTGQEYQAQQLQEYAGMDE